MNPKEILDIDDINGNGNSFGIVEVQSPDKPRIQVWVHDRDKRLAVELYVHEFVELLKERKLIE